MSRNPIVKIISLRNHASHHSMDVAANAEDELAQLIEFRLIAPVIDRRKYILQQNRIARNIKSLLPSWSPKVFFDSGARVFLFLMWVDKSVVEILEDPSRKKWVYLFDSWAPEWSNLKRKMSRWKNVQTLYLPSRKSVEYFAANMKFRVSWLPQAATYKPFDNIGRKRQILNIGRSNKALKEFFQGFSVKHNFTFLSQDAVEDILFENRDDYLRALQESAIVVVHPRILDHPEVTGNISTITARYYEAYQSNSIVCGYKATDEWSEVFPGYPFVEFDGDPCKFEEELLVALENREVWEKAANQCRVEHSWASRAKQIQADIFGANQRS